jgi:HCOMODA/2-hydroxy-3-carboxy-muconic semialdehyde decarboxylase
MRGHGSAAVAASLRLAVYRAIYTEVNARLQADAMRLGEWTALTREEGLAAAITNAGQVDRAWGMWLLKAREHSKVG